MSLLYLVTDKKKKNTKKKQQQKTKTKKTKQKKKHAMPGDFFSNDVSLMLDFRAILAISNKSNLKLLPVNNKIAWQIIFSMI